MRWIITFLWIISPVLLWSQTTLEEYRSQVVDYSLKLKISNQQIDYTAENLAKERVERLPEVSISGEFSQQLRSIDNQESWRFSLQPQITQTIYAGGAIRGAIASQENEYDVALLNDESYMLDVRFTADLAYYKLITTRDLRDAVNEYIEIIRSLREVVLLRFKEGYISKGDVLMIDTRLSEAEYQQIALEQEYSLALHSFNTLRGVEADRPTQLALIDVDSMAMPSRSALEDLLSRRPDYLASLRRIRIAESSILIARAAYNPHLSVGIAGIWHPKTPNINGSTQMDGSLFLRLSAPIFHFGERRSSVGAATSQLGIVELQCSELADTIGEEESNTWSKIIDSHAQLLNARSSLILAEENLSISTYSYREGLTTILDVMQAQISWLQLYTNSIWSEFNYLAAISAYRKIAALDL